MNHHFLAIFILIIGTYYYTTNQSTLFVQAWGKEGHEIIANLAWNRLSPLVQSKVIQLLNHNTEEFDSTSKSSPLASIANWADKVRFTKYYAWTTPLHYVDVKDKQIQGGCDDPMTCSFEYSRDCGSNDLCAVSAIHGFSHNIFNPSSSSSSLLLTSLLQDTNHTISNIGTRQSLMFLTHIIGDIHQPLHVSRESDRGGNTIKISFFPKEFPTFDPSDTTTSQVRLDYTHGVDDDGSYFIIEDRGDLKIRHTGWNLHSIWDEAIIEHAMELYFNNSQDVFQQYIQNTMLSNQTNIDTWSGCANGLKWKCVDNWAEESLEFALSFAYRDEKGNEISSGSSLSNAYFESRLLVVMQRLAAGGVRLADTLMHVLNHTVISNHDDKNIMMAVQ